MMGSKKIKDIFIDNKIPRDKRNRIPILTDFKDVIWVPEQSMNRNYKVDSNTKRILRIVIKELEEGKSWLGGSRLNNPIKKVLLSEEEIDKRVRELAKEISEDYRGKDLLVVGILKGAVVFLSD